MSETKKEEPKNESVAQPRLHNFETAPIANSIFEIGEKGVQVAGQGFLIGSIFGMVFLSNPQTMNTFGTSGAMHYEQIANVMGKCGGLIAILLASHTITVQSLQYAQNKKDHVAHQAAGFGLMGFIAGGLPSMMDGSPGPITFMKVRSLKGLALGCATGTALGYTLTKMYNLSGTNSTVVKYENKVKSVLGFTSSKSAPDGK